MMIAYLCSYLLKAEEVKEVMGLFCNFARLQNGRYYMLFAQSKRLNEDDVVGMVTRFWMIFERDKRFFIIYFGKYGFSFTTMECNILKERKGNGWNMLLNMKKWIPEAKTVDSNDAAGV